MALDYTITQSSLRTGGVMHGVREFLNQCACARMTSQDFSWGEARFETCGFVWDWGTPMNHFSKKHGDSTMDVLLLPLVPCHMSGSLLGWTLLSCCDPSVSPFASTLADSLQKSPIRHVGERHWCPHPWNMSGGSNFVSRSSGNSEISWVF